MRKATLYLMIGTMLALVTLGTTEYAAAQDVTTVVTFNRSLGQLPESIAIDKDQNIYVSFAPIHVIEKVAPDGTMTTFATLPAGLLLGVAVGADDNIYALLNGPPSNKGVWRVTPDGTATKYASIPSAAFLNALAFDKSGNLYVTDSFNPTLWRVATDGTVSAWLVDASVLGGTPNPTPCGNHPANGLGANGIAFNKGNLFVLNTTKSMIVSIPVNPDGRPGTPTIFAGPTCDLFGADGQAFDNGDNLYVADNIQNKIVRVDPSGSVTTIASGSPPFFTPTAIAFQTGLGLRKTIFITNATLFLPSATSGIVKMDVGVPGQPLP